MKDIWSGSGAHCMLGLVAVTASSSCYDGRLSSRRAAARMGFSAQQHIETSHNGGGVGKLMHLETWESVSTVRYRVAVRYQTNTLSCHPMYSPSSTHVRGAGTAGRARPLAHKRELKLLNYCWALQQVCYAYGWVCVGSLCWELVHIWVCINQAQQQGLYTSR